MTACTSANGRGGMLSCVVLNLWMYASATAVRSDLQCQRDAALAGPPVCGAGQLTDVGARGQQLRCLDPQPLQAVDRREHPLGTALVQFQAQHCVTGTASDLGSRQSIMPCPMPCPTVEKVLSQLDPN